MPIALQNAQQQRPCEKTLPSKLFIPSASALVSPSLDGNIDSFGATAPNSVPDWIMPFLGS